MTNKRFKISPKWQLRFLDMHPVQKSIVTHFHPCNPVFPPKNNTCSILFCGIFLSNLFVHLVPFGNITWKLENGNLYDQP